MSIEIVKTEDGSHSLYNKELNEHYHSTHGAIQESKHVFIEAGLRYLRNNTKQLPTTPTCSILEIGLGTGLNAFLTYLESEKSKSIVNYTAIEAFPISIELANKLNYVELLNEQNNIRVFNNLHLCDWEQEVIVSDYFNFQKIKTTLQDITFNKTFDLVYFDAFAPDVQPEMWTEEIFQKIYDKTNPKGCLVTYCAKGVVKRTLKKVGYVIESIPGPPGKREMVRAIKE